MIAEPVYQVLLRKSPNILHTLHLQLVVRQCWIRIAVRELERHDASQLTCVLSFFGGHVRNTTHHGCGLISTEDASDHGVLTAHRFRALGTFVSWHDFLLVAVRLLVVGGNCYRDARWWDYR